MEHIIAYNPYKNGNKGSVSSQPLSVYDKTIAYPWMADLVAAIREGNDELNLRLWDVVFEKEGPDWYLRVLIDKDGTMDTDTCADVSHALDPILDEADPIDQSYYLEVGSPGLGRKLTRPEHYEALKGQKIRVKLIRPNADGVREFSGILTGREGSTVTVNTDAGAVTFEVNAASGVNLCDDEDLFD